MNRRIAHLDMDAFFASVELLHYPELRGRAVVVGGRSIHQPIAQPDGSRRFARLREYAGRGVVTTSTYEARALGVHSGMGLCVPVRDSHQPPCSARPSKRCQKKQARCSAASSLSLHFPL